MNELKKALSPKEQEFAADHYGLVFSFLRSRRLEMDDYHDVVILTYLKAVQDYVRRDELQRYSFAAIACCRMRYALYTYWAHESKRTRILAPVRSHELGFWGQEPSTRASEVEDIVEAKCEWERLNSAASKKERKVLVLREAGYTNQEISCQEGVRPSCIYNRVWRFRGRIKRLAA